MYLVSRRAPSARRWSTRLLCSACVYIYVCVCAYVRTCIQQSQNAGTGMICLEGMARAVPRRRLWNRVGHGRDKTPERGYHGYPRAGSSRKPWPPTCSPWNFWQRRLKSEAVVMPWRAGPGANQGAGGCTSAALSSLSTSSPPPV